MKRLFVLFLLVSCGSVDEVEEASPSSVPAAPASVDLRFGPEDGDDPTEVARYLAPPGSDDTYVAEAPVGSERFIRGYVAGASPVIHHLNLILRTAGAPAYEFRKSKTLPGLAFSSIDRRGPVSFSEPPEYEDAALRVPDDAVSWAFDIHAVNTSSEPRVIEGWIDLDFAEAPKTVLAFFRFSGGLSMVVPPGSRAIVQTGGGETCLAPELLSIVSIMGHQHRHGRGISVILNQKLEMYSDADWEHPHRATFTSAATNPVGDFSGVLTIGRRTPIAWTCDIDNDLTTEIRYGSNISTDEMCALAGFFTSPDPKPWSCLAQ
jgi:hypothetical protein